MSWYGDDLKANSAAMTRDLKNAWEAAKKATADAADALSSARAKYAAAVFALSEAVDAAAVTAAANAVATALAGVTAAEAAMAAASAALEAAAVAAAAAGAFVGGCYVGQGIGLIGDALAGQVAVGAAKAVKVWKKMFPSRRVIFPPASYSLAVGVAHEILKALDASNAGHRQYLAEVQANFFRQQIFQHSPVCKALHDITAANVLTFMHLAQAATYASEEDTANAAIFAACLPGDFSRQALACSRAAEVFERHREVIPNTNLSLAEYKAFVARAKAEGPAALPEGEGLILRLLLMAVGLEASDEFERFVVEWIVAPNAREAFSFFKDVEHLTMVDLIRKNGKLWEELAKERWDGLISAGVSSAAGGR